jgi:hypothetical protein
MQGSEGTCYEYREKEQTAVIYLGSDLEERMEKVAKYTEKIARNNEAKAALLDFREVGSVLSRDAGQIIAVRNALNESVGVYLCNVGRPNLQVLEILGVTKLPGIYVRDSVEETLEELAA